MNNSVRAARIICSQDTLFGILKKYDYKITLGLSMKKEIKAKAQFLRNFPLFQNVTDTKLQKITYSMTIKKFQRGEIVYKKGQTQVKGIYLIKQGEFEVTKITDIKHPN